MSGNAIAQQLAALPEEGHRRDLLISATGRRSHADARAGMFAYAGWLSGEGMRAGERIAICLPKTMEAVQLIYGVLALGAAYVPLQYPPNAARVADVLAAIRPALLITTRTAAAGLRQAGADIAAGRIVEVDDDEGALAALHRGIPPLRTPAEVEAGDLAVVFFTSGSTSAPKGVMWSQRGLATSVCATAARRGTTAADRMMSVAPLHYSASCEIFYPVMAGASVYLCSERETLFADRLAALLEREATTIWGSTSTALRLLVEGGALGARDLGAIRLVEFFGEPMPAAVLRQAMAAMPNGDFRFVYGATEAFNIVEYRVPRPLTQETGVLPLGFPCAGYDFSLRDEAGRTVGPEETGEICIAGPGVAMGYWNESPGAAMRRLAGIADSFRTGDMARAAEGGLIRFAGRADQMVKIRGHRFELGELEAAARSEPRVGEAIGFAGDDSMTLALLSSAPEGEYREIAEAVRRLCLQRLPRYAQPQRIVIRREFPLLASGKVDRRTLRALIAESGDAISPRRR